MVSEVQDGTESSHQYHIPTDPPKVCFRTYDIRGHVGADSLTPDLAYAIGLAIGTQAQEQGEKKIIAARDGRLSGPEFIDALIAGLRDSGVDVIFIGVVPTPVLYFATNWLPVHSGVMLTASHNPKDHNGFKIVLAGKTLSQQGIEKLYHRIKAQDFLSGSGTLEQQDVADDYVNYVTDHINLERPLKIVLDCGNGVGGDIGPRLFRALGCEVIELYCEIDGNFPNHHPDPTVPDNLTDLINKVKEVKADMGLALDGDADRLGLVTNKGEIIWPDRQMMLFSIEILADLPGAEIIFDVKCSNNLAKVIKEHGGKPIMWRTGHSVIKAKLFESGAPFAGELSGHIFFKDDWFGFDDGMYVGARLAQNVSRSDESVSDIFAALPNSINTPELKLAMDEKDKSSFMQRLISNGQFPGAEKITIDGIRLEFADGWALVRPSNTSPYIILRFEADTEAALERIKELMRKEILAIEPKLNLPF